MPAETPSPEERALRVIPTGHLDAELRDYLRREIAAALHEAVAAARADERERCAKVAESASRNGFAAMDYPADQTAEYCGAKIAAAIRALPLTKETTDA